MTFRSVVDQPHPANPRNTSTGLSGGDADGRTAEHLVAVSSDASLTVTNNGENLKRKEIGRNTLGMWTTSELLVKLYASLLLCERLNICFWQFN